MPVKSGKLKQGRKTADTKCISKRIITEQNHISLSLRKPGCISALRQGGKNRHVFYTANFLLSLAMGCSHRDVNSQAVLGHSGFGSQIKFTGTNMQVQVAENTESRYQNGLRGLEWAQIVIVSHFKSYRIGSREMESYKMLACPVTIYFTIIHT